MATTYRFSVVVWEDYAGGFTGRLLDARFEEAAVYAASVNDVISQTKEFLDQWYREDPWSGVPEFLEPKVTHVSVRVRPAYREREEMYPCAEQITLKVPCVHGHEEGGMLTGYLPTLDSRFNYYEKGALKGLATHFAQTDLEGCTPEVLRSYVCPKTCAVHEIPITVKLDEKKKEDKDWINWREKNEAKQLANVAEPLSIRSARGRSARAWEREAEVADLLSRLRSERASIVLLGEPGVGKSAILVDAARQLERDIRRSNPGAYPYRLWATSAHRIIAGMQWLGQWQARCEELVAELSEMRGILCVDNMLDLVRMGGRGPLDSIAAFFMTFMKRGDLRMVVEATPAEIDSCRRMLPGFTDLFQVLNVPAFPEEQAKEVLGKVGNSMAHNSHIEFGEEVSELTYRLFSRFLPYSVFPGKAVAFLQNMFETTARQKKKVNEQTAFESFTKQTGLPELFLKDEIVIEADDVLARFQESIIGQDAACMAARDLVTRFKAGMNDPLRPLGVLLFCGPTGVGKTALARAIAQYFFGSGKDSDRLVRLDMSEYGGYGAGERLISQASGEPSDFIQKMRKQPFSVVLLDEIEKAAPEVFDVFLNVFDEGRLVDRYGRLTTFRSSIIIMTSNLGARQQGSLGFAEKPPAYEAEVMAFFRPEFYNRLDTVVTFDPLPSETVLEITRKELREISDREGLKARKLRLMCSDALVGHVGKEGFDHRYGARPLQRAIERLVVTPLAEFLVANPKVAGVELAAELGDDGKVAFARR